MSTREAQIASMVAKIGQSLVEAFNEAAIPEPPALGFCLWVFEFNDDPFLACVSNEFTNARRPELIRLMREHLASLEASEAADRAARRANDPHRAHILFDGRPLCLYMPGERRRAHRFFDDPAYDGEGYCPHCRAELAAVRAERANEAGGHH
jgi:hypothetical protein